MPRCHLRFYRRFTRVSVPMYWLQHYPHSCQRTQDLPWTATAQRLVVPPLYRFVPTGPHAGFATRQDTRCLQYWFATDYHRFCAVQFCGIHFCRLPTCCVPQRTCCWLFLDHRQRAAAFTDDVRDRMHRCAWLCRSDTARGHHGCLPRGGRLPLLHRQRALLRIYGLIRGLPGSCHLWTTTV